MSLVQGKKTPNDSAPYYVKTLSFPRAFVKARLRHRDNYPALASLKGYGIHCQCVPMPHAWDPNEKAAEIGNSNGPKRLQLIREKCLRALSKGGGAVKMRSSKNEEQ